ncbi:methyltransferase domain-containing protein [Thermococcus zilligii]|uniref:methyltransferase domain-containing protein n=1 Tax=Thermococcus zilligii TaxID=54076 RepID=UPI001ED8D223|nr:methyltransferase domain-containing protein [Thermococcus zilligii]
MREFRLPAGAKILDVGCGVGRHSIELARRGYRVTGVDIEKGLFDPNPMTFFEEIEAPDGTKFPIREHVGMAPPGGGERERWTSTTSRSWFSQRSPLRPEVSFKLFQTRTCAGLTITTPSAYPKPVKTCRP